MEPTDPKEGVAVIGMSGRFPGARNIKEFWQGLIDGRELITRFSAEDLIACGLDPAILKSPGYVNAGGVIDDIEMFDAAFFGYTPREAEILDPQQRLFLECSSEALEGAGYNPHTYEGLISVYGGVGLNTYVFNLYSNPSIMGLMGAFQVNIANDKDHVTTRVAYKLNLKGPAVTVQTACSTSLVAVCLACQSVMDYQCDMALAGGASILLPQRAGYMYQPGAISSPDGHCRAFDARAQGTVGGNGVGVVLLKRLEDAIADGDFIHAVIRGWNINNDGLAKVGYTAPSVHGQVQAIAAAQAMAQAEPESISYIEAHGTGTTLGDPIEIEALTQVFSASTDKTGFCAIGTVKTNIGHTDTAAGVAGLIKTVLSLEHAVLPPSLNYERPNPRIDFANSPFFVNTSLREWNSSTGPCRAGVSSFGIGGTNAHVVLEEAPTRVNLPASRAWHLLCLSARTDTALETITTNLSNCLRETPDLSLADVAYTLHLGRRAFTQRRMVVCQNLEDAVRALDSQDSGRVFTAASRPSERRVVFMFPGQGAQYINMGLELYKTERGFRTHVDRCCDLLRSHLGFDLRQVLYPATPRTEEASRELDQTAVTQVALFVVEYALAQLWMEWGIRPVAMIGHSLGEYVAACLAGVFSLEDALAVVAVRGRLMQEMAEGAMLAVSLPESKLLSYLDRHLSLAAVNTPSQCVVSGTPDAVQQLEKQLIEQGIPCHRLRTTRAFHSSMTEPVLNLFREQVKTAKLSSPTLPFLSNITGSWITSEEAISSEYWTRHIRRTVRFSGGLQRLLQEKDWVLLEVGPGRTLCGLAQQHSDAAPDRLVLPSLRHPNEQRSDVEFLLRGLGQLWAGGAEIDWTRFYANERRLRVPLPTYPFERQRYWVERAMTPRPVATATPATGIERKVDEWFYVPSWRQSPLPLHFTAADTSPWLIFLDQEGFGERLARRLELQGRPVATVAIGPEFVRSGNHRYLLNPQKADDYLALVNDLRQIDMLPGTIAHLWSLSTSVSAQTSSDAVETAQETGFFSLVFLAQALGSLAINVPLQLGVVTSQVQNVSGNERLVPAKATILGPCRVIPQEYPRIRCRAIDIVPPESGSAAGDELIDLLIGEFASESQDTMVAYRSRQRWIQTFEKMRLEEPAALPPLREGGVYLITGGLGGIGLVLAHDLARTVNAKLVLLARSAFPERAKWSDWLAGHDESDSVSAKIRQLQEIESAGGQVMVISADVADLEKMQSALEAVHERFGDLHGVIHAAGVAGGGVIQFKSRDLAVAVMTPKIRGTLVLDALLKNTQLDFFLLCSSLASILGGPGQVDYCAGNTFLDAYANAATSGNAQHVVSLNWDRWQETGMAVNTHVPADMQRRRAESLEYGLLSQEGVQAFRRALGSARPQIAISTLDLQSLLQASVAAPKQPGRSEPVDRHTSQHPRPPLTTAYAKAEKGVEQTIVGIWQELFGIMPIGIYDDFFELGGHSLLAIQLSSRLSEAFALDLPVRAIFDAPTAAQLARVIEQARGEAYEDGDEDDRILDLVEDESDD